MIVGNSCLEEEYLYRYSNQNCFASLFIFYLVGKKFQNKYREMQNKDEMIHLIVKEVRLRILSLPNINAI